MLPVVCKNTLNRCYQIYRFLESGKNLDGYHGNTGQIKSIFTKLDQAYDSLQ